MNQPLPIGPTRLLKNVMSAGKTRRNPTKERSLPLVNAHFEEDPNALLPRAVGFQPSARVNGPGKDRTSGCVWRRFAYGIILSLVSVIVPLAMSPSALAQKRVHSVYFEGTDHELNVYRIHGEELGKTLLLIGGIQGDEPGGFLSADHYADISLAKGSLIVVPRANFQSIVLNRRKINADMNRKFSEEQGTSYETKIVTILKQLVAESDGLLNLHDGSGFYSEKWENADRNPLRYGQSIIADCEIYKNPASGETVDLGSMARSVIERINRAIKEPGHHFHFSNHKTRAADSLHKEQRKSEEGPSP